MKHKLLLLYSWFVRTILFFFPDVPFIMRFRGFLYGLGMKSCGCDFQVAHDTIVRGLEKITVGNNVFIGNLSWVIGIGSIIIEDQVLIGPHCVIIARNHATYNGSYRYKSGIPGEIKLGYGSWVSANCTIVKGGHLPKNSVLAANSLLNRYMEHPNSIYGGVPAILLKQTD